MTFLERLYGISFSSCLCVMHIKVVFLSTVLFFFTAVTKGTLHLCCSISATCCQRVNLGSNSARLLFLFCSDVLCNNFIKLKLDRSVFTSDLEIMQPEKCSCYMYVSSLFGL